MSFRPKLFASVIAITLAVSVGVIYFQQNRSEQINGGQGATPVARTDTFSKSIGSTDKNTEAVASKSSVPASVDSVTKSQLVEKLRASGSPVDAFAAYKLIRACIVAKRAESEVDQNPESAPKIPSAQACEDISPGQMVSRFRLLEKAAESGVHGAMYAFVSEGPNGDGNLESQDPTSPATVEWERHIRDYQEAGVKTGDRYSLMSLSNYYENEEPRDFSKALSYWVAQNELDKAKTGKADSKNYLNIVARLSLSLTPEQASAAIFQGRQIADAAKANGALK